MATEMIVTYECRQCGSELVVTESRLPRLSPIYCCGTEVIEISSGEKRAAKPKKASAKKIVKKQPKKKAVKKVKSAAKKKIS